MQVLVSLHDVTPAHLDRLERAEALFREVGLERVAYLLVPDYHRRHAIAADATFHQWCRRPRPFAIEWVLHGYFHLEDVRDASTGGGAKAWFARRVMTAGEGEFLGLSAAQQRDRIAGGREAVAAAAGVVPSAFVPPAWLANASLAPVLAELGFVYTETHLHVVDVQRSESRRCPAVTWATRTLGRRVGSRLVCPVSFELFRRLGVMRIAIHPFDLDWSATRAQVRRLLGRALDRGTAIGYDELFSG